MSDDPVKQKRSNALARAHFGLTRIPRAKPGFSAEGEALVRLTFPRQPEHAHTHDMLILEISNAFHMFDIEEARVSRIASGQEQPSPAEERTERGRPTYKGLDDLLRVLVKIWQREFPRDGRGITRTNSAKGGRRIRGPLLDFAYELLKVEGVGYSHDTRGVADFRSSKALGARLLELMGPMVPARDQ